MILRDKSRYLKKKPIFVGTISKYNVFKSTHTYETRDGSKLSRGEFYTQKTLMEILNSAFLQGITSFKNKNVVISFLDEDKNTCAILAEMNEDKIFVITMYNSIDVVPYKRLFKFEQNRINLWNYTLRNLSEEEHNETSSERFNYYKKHAPLIIKKKVEVNNKFQKKIRKVQIF